MHKEYLGDSVYAEIDNGMIKIYLDNGHGPSDTIYLELEVIDALNRYVQRIKSIYASGHNEE
jgi:hypothetical protein